MSAPAIQQWPPPLLRSVSSIFTLGALNGFVQPLFSAMQSPFGDPFEQRWLVTLQSPPMQGQESYGNGRAGPALRPSYREIEGRIASLRGINRYLRIFDPLNIRPQFDLALMASNGVTAANWSGGRRWSDGRRWISGLLPPSVTVDAAVNTEGTSLVLRG